MAIRVKNLIEELQQLDPELHIVMSSDPEGNSYGFLSAINTNNKLHEGEVYLAELTSELKKEGYGEEDVSKEGVDCVVFYPGDDTYMLEKLIMGMKKED